VGPPELCLGLGAGTSAECAQLPELNSVALLNRRRVARVLRECSQAGARGSALLSANALRTIHGRDSCCRHRTRKGYRPLGGSADCQLESSRIPSERARVTEQDAAGIDLSSRLEKRKIEQRIARVRKKHSLIRKSPCGSELRPLLNNKRSRAKLLGRMLPQLQIAPAPGGVMGIATPRTGVATSTAQVATTTPGVAFQPHVATLLRSMAAAATSTACVSRAQLLSTITISTHRCSRLKQLRVNLVRVYCLLDSPEATTEPESADIAPPGCVADNREYRRISRRPSSRFLA
jgi:hypothetical protein